MKIRASGSAKMILVLIVACGLFLGLAALRNYQTEKDNLLSRLRETAKEKEQFVAKLEEMRNCISPLEKEIKVLRDTLEQSQRKSEREEKLILENLVSAGKPKAPAAKSTKKKSPPALAESKDKISDTKKNLDRLKDYMLAAEEKNASFAEKAEQLSSLLEAKNKEMLELTRSNAGLKADLEKAVKDQEKMKAELARQLAAIGETNSFLEKQTLKYEQEKISLQNDLNGLKEQLDKQIAINDALNKKIFDVTQALGDKEKVNLNLAKELDELREFKNNFASELDALRASKADSESQVRQMTGRINELGLSYENVRNTVSQLSNLLTRREVELNEKQSQLTELKENLEKTSKEKDLTFSSVEAKDKSISELKATLSNMESQVASLRSDLASAKEHQRKTIDQLSEITSMNTSLQERLVNISKELEPLSQDDDFEKKAADELRKKVEVKIGPGQAQDEDEEE